MFNISERAINGLIAFAIFGMVVSMLLIVVGVPAGIWLLAHHLAWH